MSHVRYLEFRDKQLLNTKEIPSKYRYHYTYRISTHDGKYYVGVRSCDCLPVDDLGHKYFGSPASKESKKLLRNPENKFKVLNTFPSRLLAILSESYYHHNLDVKHHSDFLNGCNANVKGMSSLNYEETRKKAGITRSKIQPDGFSINQRAAQKMAITRSIIQSDELTSFQRAAKDSAKTRSIIQSNGFTINQVIGMKVLETRSIIQDNGLTSYQEGGLKGARTRSVVQDDGLTIAQSKRCRSFKITDYL